MIVLPVAVLSLVSLVSLREDRILAEHEAAERARAVAENLAPRLWAELTRTNGSLELQPNTFQVDAGGGLVFPPPCASTPAHGPLDPAALSPEQSARWREAQTREAAGDDFEPALRAYRDFIDLDPPTNFLAAAQYAVGLLLARQGEPQAAAAQFELVAENYPAALGESGLPLAPLAQLKLLEFAEPGAPSQLTPSLESLCSNVVCHPTPLSSHLLDRLSRLARSAEAREVVRKWQQVWQEHEWSRALYAAARPSGTDAAPGIWFQTPESRGVAVPPSTRGPASPGGPARAPIPYRFPVPAAKDNRTWLALRVAANPAGAWYVCRTEFDTGLALADAAQEAGRVPDYLGLGFEVAGRELTWPAPDLRIWREVYYFGRRGGGSKKEYTAATATKVLASATAPGGALKVSVYLTSPTTVFKRHQARVFWYGLLAISSTVAAGIGLLAAYRAFRRQLRLSELKSNFVASVSHELRAPLASVRLMAESLDRGRVTEPSRQREYFSFIVQECRRLSGLIENVLDFSRIEQGRKQYDFEPTDLVELTRQTVRLMETSAAEREIKLALAIGLDPGFNYQPVVDGKAIQQALVNLVDNALKHSPKGETVTVGLDAPPPEPATPEPAAPGAARIQLWVEDHGPGIPAAEHEKIFERFYRTGSELRRETPGVGIGLSLVKHIVEAHGGRVLLRSEVGRGSRFTLELPVADAPGPDQSSTSPA